MPEKFAIVTGASTGIGLELARCCAKDGYDLLIAANEPAIEEAARTIRQETGAGNVEALEADLATLDGVDKLVTTSRGRSVDVLMANAGRGLGSDFLGQEFAEIQNVIDTNILGTTYLLHRIGNKMRSANGGRILITIRPGAFRPSTMPRKPI